MVNGVGSWGYKNHNSVPKYSKEIRGDNVDSADGITELTANRDFKRVF